MGLHQMEGSFLAFLILALFAAFTHSQNLNCALVVPENALTAQGLATPFLLQALDPNEGPCSMNNPDQQAFVQGIVLDTHNGHVFVYNPLVIDAGTTPAANPVVPVLPEHNVVALWFGFNGESLRLLPAPTQPDSLVQSNCINGILNGDQPDYFGQFSQCNAPAFFQEAFRLIDEGKLVVPPLGKGKDHKPCPTVRDFGVVDQDQSDNVVTSYILTTTGTVAQNTTANRRAFPGFEEINNGSDNFLLLIMDQYLGCQPFMAPDLADPGTFKSALPLNELSARQWQRQPVALVPAGNPMVLGLNGDPNLIKLNTFRVSVGQQPVITLANADTVLYCQALGTIAPIRFQSWSRYFRREPSLDPATSTNFYGFLVNRFINTWSADGLNCAGLLNLPSPIQAIVNDQGLTTGGIVISHANLIPPSAFLPGGEFYTWHRPHHTVHDCHEDRRCNCRNC